MFSGKNTNEALREQEVFLSVSFEFRSWFIACGSWRRFVMYATIARRMSVIPATVAGLLSEGWVSHLVS